jgi:hypothetical protein
MSLDTTNWVKYPFSVNGVDFISMLDPQGSFYPQVERLPAHLFNSYNVGAVTELIGNPATMTRDELLSELDKVNEGANQALICLA